jgi:hypothetical protein
MTTLYYEDERAALTEVGTVVNYVHAIELIKTFLGSQMYQIRYTRMWVEEDIQIGWCIVIDYGSWSSFFKIGGFNSAVDADVFIQTMNNKD